MTIKWGLFRTATKMWSMLFLLAGTMVMVFAGPVAAQTSEVTFSKDIAPILQRSCQNCHRPDGGAPMSLITYEETRPWARSI